MRPKSSFWKTARSWFVAFLFLWVFSPISGSAQSIEVLNEKFNQGRFEEVLVPLQELAAAGVAHAQFLLAVMYHFGEGVEMDRDFAFTLFQAAAFNPRTDGHNKAGEFLARSYLMDKASKHYDKEFGLKILRALSDLGEVESQLYMGGFLILEAEEQQMSKDLLLEESYMHFNRAAEQHSHAGAHHMVFLLQKERYGIKSKEAISAIGNLKIAAANQHTYQADAAIELAFYFRNSDEPNWEIQYVRWLKVAADLKKPEALYFLGKAEMLGLVGEQNYQQAKLLLTEAKKLGHAQSSRLLSDLEKRVLAEQKLDAFKVPSNWIDSFLAIQAFAGRDTYGSSVSGGANASYSSGYSFNKSDGELFSSSGLSFRRSGRMIVGSDGSQFSVNGNKIQNLGTGTTYRYSPSSNSLMGTNGVKYNFRGRNIYGTDGSVCTSLGQSVTCY